MLHPLQQNRQNGLRISACFDDQLDWAHHADKIPVVCILNTDHSWVTHTRTVNCYSQTAENKSHTEHCVTASNVTCHMPFWETIVNIQRKKTIHGNMYNKHNHWIRTFRCVQHLGQYNLNLQHNKMVRLLLIGKAVDINKNVKKTSSKNSSLADTIASNILLQWTLLWFSTQDFPLTFEYLQMPSMPSLSLYINYLAPQQLRVWQTIGMWSHKLIFPLTSIHCTGKHTSTTLCPTPTVHTSLFPHSPHSYIINRLQTTYSVSLSAYMHTHIHTILMTISRWNLLS